MKYRVRSFESLPLPILEFQTLSGLEVFLYKLKRILSFQTSTIQWSNGNEVSIIETSNEAQKSGEDVAGTIELVNQGQEAEIIRIPCPGRGGFLTSHFGSTGSLIQRMYTNLYGAWLCPLGFLVVFCGHTLGGH